MMNTMYNLGFFFSFFSPIGMYFFSKRQYRYTFLTCFFWLVGDIFFMIYNFIIKEYPLFLFFMLNNIMTLRLLRKTIYEKHSSNINKSNL
jgi:hypothetical protein